MAALTFLELARTRRSIRRFLPQEVSKQLLERLLEAATSAPSAHNSQPWRFVVCQDQSAKKRLADLMGDAFLADLIEEGLSSPDAEQRVENSRQRIQQAPVVIVLFLETLALEPSNVSKLQFNERLMAVQSVAMAGENLLLAAQAEGLGGVWICAPLFAPQAVRQALTVPESWEAQGLILLGYPTRIPSAPERKHLSEVVRFL